jgi:hypothetical protein
MEKKEYEEKEEQEAKQEAKQEEKQELKQEQEQEEKKKQLFYGAGVLPFAIVPETNDIYILLAKENIVHQWRGSNKWCEFTGSFNPAFDSDPADTAAREFLEESLCVVPFHQHQDQQHYRNQISTKESIAAELRKDETNSFKIITNSSKDKKTPIHYCFVREIEWIPDLPERFAKTRKVLLTLQEEFQKYKSMLESLIQSNRDDHLKLESSISFLPMIHNNNNNKNKKNENENESESEEKEKEKEKNVEEEEESFIKIESNPIYVIDIQITNGNFVQTTLWNSITDKTFQYELSKNTFDSKVLDCIKQYSIAKKIYNENKKGLLASCKKCGAILKDYIHSSSLKKKKWTTLSVSEAFLEKTQMKWWSQSKLQSVLFHGGKYHNQKSDFADFNRLYHHLCPEYRLERYEQFRFQFMRILSILFHLLFKENQLQVQYQYQYQYQYQQYVNPNPNQYQYAGKKIKKFPEKKKQKPVQFFNVHVKPLTTSSATSAAAAAADTDTITNTETTTTTTVSATNATVGADIPDSADRTLRYVNN